MRIVDAKKIIRNLTLELARAGVVNRSKKALIEYMQSALREELRRHRAFADARLKELLDAHLKEMGKRFSKIVNRKEKRR